MSLNARNIHIGAGRIWLNVTAPATGTPPTALAHIGGVPTIGSPVEVGYTTGPATFMYHATKTEIEAEQSLNIVDIFVSKEECSLSFTALERHYWTLKTSLDNVGAVNNSEHLMFYGGDGTTIVNVETQCIALTSQRRDSLTKYETIVLYKVYNVDATEIPYARTTPSQVKITLKAIVDTCRVPGDRLFQLVREVEPGSINPCVAP